MRGRAAAAGAVALGALLLVWPSLWNGFPMVYTDTGTYIDSAFTLIVPPDRPVGYSLFIRAVGGRRSLWPVVCCQALIFSFILHRFSARLAPHRGAGAFLSACAIFAALTGLPWIMGTVFADAFTPSCLLAMFLLLLPGGGAAEAAACAAIFVASNAVHFSHVPICAIVLGCVAAARSARRLGSAPSAGRCALTALLLAVSFLLVPAINASLGKGFRFPRATDVFLMSRIWENGMLKRLLDERCPEGRYEFCRFKDEIRGTATYFHWNPHSPLYRTGGWNAPHEEYRRIVIDALTAYPGMWLANCARLTGTQLLLFDAGGAVGPLAPRTWIYRVLRNRYPDAFGRFLSSRQQRDALHRRLFRGAQYATVAASLALVAFGLIRRRARDDRLFRLFLWFAAAAIVANAAVCASISLMDDRYGARVIWLVPLCALLMLAREGRE